MPRRFDPSAFVSDTPQEPAPDLVILNQPIENLDLLCHVWGRCRIRVCADGGANRLYDALGSVGADRRSSFVGGPHRRAPSELTANQLPNAVCGDLDSLRPDVRKYYSTRGVAITVDRDQNSTDMTKAIAKLAELRPQPVAEIVVLGTIAGRVDHGLGILHEMLRQQQQHQHRRLWLMSQGSLSFILPPGLNEIAASSKSSVLPRGTAGYLQPLEAANKSTISSDHDAGTDKVPCDVGIVPIYGPACITTTGLKWDVVDWPTEMGGQVSTSNQLASDCATVRTDHAVLFTMALTATEESRRDPAQ